MKNLEQLIAQHTKDGVTDYKSIEEAVNKEINDTVAKSKPDKDKLIADYKSDWIASLGFEGVTDETQLKAYVKGTSNEWKEKYDGLKKETDASLQEYGTKFTNYEKDLGELNTLRNQRLLRGKGVLDDEQLEFLEFKINKLDGETFEEKLNAYAESNPDTFTPPNPQKNVITTGAKIGSKAQTDSKLGWETIIDERFGE